VVLTTVPQYGIHEIAEREVGIGVGLRDSLRPTAQRRQDSGDCHQRNLARGLCAGIRARGRP